MRSQTLTLRQRAKASHMAFVERRERFQAWWQRAFRTPLVGFYGWVASRSASLWAAMLTILGLARPDRLAPRNSAIRTGKSYKQAFTRSLLHAEGLEQRQLMAVDVITTIEPDTFAEDQNISTASPYVTLSGGSGITVHASTTNSSTGTKGFAPSDNLGPTTDVWGQMKATFNVAGVKSVSVDVVADDFSDGGLLQAYDSSNTRVAWASVSGADGDTTSGMSAPGFKTLTVNSVTPIAYVTVDSGASEYDNLQFTAPNVAPVVNDQTYSAAESVPTGTTVGTVTASDAFGGAPLTFSKTGGSSLLSIDAATGAVKTTGPLNFEAGTSHQITVQVSDGDLTDTAVITLNVTDVAEQFAIAATDFPADGKVRIAVDNSVSPARLRAYNSSNVELSSVPSHVLSNVTSISVVGRDGLSDELTVDINGLPAGMLVSYNGGTGGSDALRVIDTSATVRAGVNHSFDNSSTGSISVVGGPTISYTGLEPVVDNLSATNRVFTFLGGAEAITLTASPVPGFTHRIDSTLGESVDFNLPTTSLTISAADAADTLSISTPTTGINVAANVATVTLSADIGGTVTGTATTVNVNNGGVIQDGIDAASTSAPAVVNVQAGAYTGNVDTTGAGKQIELRPAANAVGPAVTINGNLSMNANDTLVVQVSDSANDSLTVNGTVALGGATLALNASAVTSPLPATPLTIINNDGAVDGNGQFNGLPEGSLVVANTRLFKISYVGGDGNNVILTPLSITLDANDTPPQEALTNGQFSVFLSQPVVGNTVVNFTVSGGAVAAAAPGGPAANPNDYQTITSPVTILSGQTEAVIDVIVFDDLTAEDTAAERVEVTLTSVNGNALPAAGPFPAPGPGVAPAGQLADVVTIIDNDPSTISITSPDNVINTEDKAGETATFKVSLTKASATPTEIWINLGGAASITPGVDYTFAFTGGATITNPGGAPSGSNRLLTIPAGQTDITITATPFVESLVEATEDIVLTLNSVKAGTLATISASKTATINIIDDDSAVVTLDPNPTSDVSGNDPDTAPPSTSYPVSGDDGKLVVRMTNPSSTDTVLTYSISAPPALGAEVFFTNFDSGVPGTVVTSAGANGSVGGVSNTLEMRRATGTNAMTSPNTATLTLDLSQARTAGGAVLTFDHTKLGNEAADNALPATFTGTPNADGVAISNDGTNWVRAVNLTTSGSYTVNLERVAYENGLTLGPNFRVRFFQFDAGTSNVNDAGRRIDNIRVVQGDYDALSGTVTVLAGQTTAAIDIKVINDLVVEGTENVTLILSTTKASGDADISVDPLLVNRQQTVTITDSDTALATITNAGNGKELGPVNGKFNVNLVSAGYGLPMRSDTNTTIAFEVDPAIAASATYGVDYTLSGTNVTFNPGTLKGTIMIPAGETQGVINVTVLQETDVEDDEFVSIKLLNTPAIVGDPQITASATPALVAIQDEDAALVRLNKVNDGSEPGTKGMFIVDLVRTLDMSTTLLPIQQVVSNVDTVVTYTVLVGPSPIAKPGAAAGGPVSDPNDYQTLSGTVTIPAGQTFAFIDVNVFDDLKLEPTETVTVTLSNVQSGDASTSVHPSQKTATVNIADNDTLTVKVTKASDGKEDVLNAPGADATDGKFTLFLDGDAGALAQYQADAGALGAAGNVVVTYTLSGLASNGIDYQSLNGTATIAAGQSTTTVLVDVIDDLFFDPAETVILQITGVTSQPSLGSGGKGVGFDNKSATLTITDNEVGGVSITTIKNARESDTNGEITFELTGASPFNTVVTYAVTPSGPAPIATQGSDHNLLSGTVTFLAGETKKTITVPVLNDTVKEDTEIIPVQITGFAPGGNGGGYGFDPTLKNVLILQDQTVDIVGENNGAEGGKNASFVIGMQAKSTADTVVTYQIVPAVGDAQDGVDFNSLAPYTATIAAGQTTVTVTLSVIDDAIIEGTENVTIKLLSVTNAADPDITIGAEVPVNSANEVADAGNLPGTAQVTSGSYGLKTITGNLSSGADQDMFLIRIDDPAAFAAAETTGNFDSQLFLFKADGKGIVSDDDSGPGTQAAIGIPFSNLVPAPGLYYLAISAFNADATSGGNSMWLSDTNQAPNGPGALGAVDGWTTGGSGGAYSISLAGATFAGYDAVGTVSIADNDAGFIQVSGVKGKEGGPDAKFTITQSAPASTDTVVTYTLSTKAPPQNANPAGPSQDHALSYIQYTATIAAGQTSTTVTVPIDDDALVERDDETVVLTLNSIIAGDPQIKLGTIAGPTVTFRQGLNGYTGTADTYIGQANPTVDFGNGLFISVSTDSLTPGGALAAQQGLIRFDSIFGSGLVPLNSSIANAQLNFAGPLGANVNLHEALIAWSESTTWNTSFGGNGIQANGTEASAAFINGLNAFTVTSAVQNWANGGANNGWAILPASAVVGWDASSSEEPVAGVRPTLTITVATSAEVVIEDNDSATINISSTINGKEPGGLLSTPTGVTNAGKAIVSIDKASSSDTVVTYKITDKTATGGGVDHNAPAAVQTLTITAGQTSATILVEVTDDFTVEGQENVQVELLSVDYGAGKTDPQITLGTKLIDLVAIDDDDIGLLSITASNGAENNPVVATVTNKALTSNVATLTTSAPHTLTVGEQVLVSIGDPIFDGEYVVTAVPTATTFSYSKVNINIPSAAATGTAINQPLDGKFVITTTKASDSPTVIPYSIVVTNASDATVGAGKDYLLKDGTKTLAGSVTLPAFLTSVEVTIDVLEDFINEGTENVTLQLLPPTGKLTIGPTSKATAQIVDDDNLVISVVATDPEVVEGADAGVNDGLLTVGLNYVSDSDIQVVYSVGGTATPGAPTALYTNGNDYAPLPGSGSPLKTIVIPAGQTQFQLPVEAYQDYFDEVDETVIVTLSSFKTFLPSTTTLSNNSNSALDALALSDTVTIKDEVFDITLFKTDSPAQEPGLGSGGFNGQFTVYVTNDLTEPLVVYLQDVTTAGPGKAVLGTDYNYSGSTNPVQTVTIQPGQTSATLTVTVIDDALSEGTETIDLKVSGFSYAKTLGSLQLGSPITAVETILDNDNQNVTVSATDGKDKVGGLVTDADDGKFTFTQSFKSPYWTKVSYAIDTVTDAATPGSDYTAIPAGFVTIAPNATTNSILLDVLGDAIVEGDEFVKLKITGVATFTDAALTIPAPNPVTGTGNSATAKIVDEDVATLKMTGTSNASEPSGLAFFTVEQSAVASTDTVIAYTVTGGTATAGVDYNHAPTNPLSTAGKVTIPAGSTQAFITVSVLDDLIIEANPETVELTLASSTTSSDPQVTVSAQKTSTVDIADNDFGKVTIVKVQDGKEGGSNGIFNVHLRDSLTGTTPLTSDVNVVVTYLITGTANPGASNTNVLNGPDYQQLSVTRTGTVTINSGSTTAAININVFDDSFVESLENVTLSLLTVTTPVPPATTRAIDLGTITAAVTNKSLTGNVATLTTAAPHGLVPGQTVVVAINDPVFDGTYVLGAGTGGTTLNYAKVSPNVASAAASGLVVHQTTGSSAVTTKELTSNVATLTTAAPHNLIPGQTVVVAIGDPVFDGTFVVSSVPNATTFTYDRVNPNVALAGTAGSVSQRAVASTVNIVDNDKATLSISGGAFAEGNKVFDLSGATLTLSLDKPFDVDTEWVVSYAVQTATVSNKALAANVATLTTTTPHGFSVGQPIVVAGVDATFDGSYVVTGVPTPTTLTYAKTAANVASTASGGTVTLLNGAIGAGGDNVFGADFDNTPDTVKFLAGETVKTFKVDFNEEDPNLNGAQSNLVEDNEKFLTSVTNKTSLSGYSFDSSAKSEVTITNDDTATYKINDVSVNESAGTLSFTISVDNPVDMPVKLKVNYTDDAGVLGATGKSYSFFLPTLPAGTDYDNDTDGVSFGTIDVANKTVTVTINEDTIVEGGTVNNPGSETFTASSSVDADSFKLLPQGGRLFNNADTGTGSIVDQNAMAVPDSATVTLSVVDANATEPSPVDDGEFKISQSQPSSVDTVIKLNIATGGTNATQGVDYELRVDGNLVTNTVTVPAGKTEISVKVNVLSDSVLEDDEFVNVYLESFVSRDPNVSAAFGPMYVGTVKIDDNDTALLSVTKSKDGAEPGAPANDGEFSISLSQLSDSDTVVSYHVLVPSEVALGFVGPAATAGQDYVALPGKVTIPANTASAKVLVDVLDDYIPAEGTEKVSLYIDSFTGNADIAINPASRVATVDILEDADGLFVKVEKVKDASEPGSGPDDGQFKVTLVDAKGNPVVVPVGSTGGNGGVTVNFTLSGSAVSPTDYSNISSVLIAEGASSGVVTIDVQDDFAIEPTEQVVITLNGTLPTSLARPVFPFSEPIAVSPTGNVSSLDILDNDNVSSIISRKIFYNGSTFDGNGAAVDAVGPVYDDFAAIASDKTPLFPNGTATFSNYTSYSKGINGIMVDIANMTGTPTLATIGNFFQFRVGNNSTPASWLPAPTPTSVTVLPGQGDSGSTRIAITWADNAIQKQWLQVIMLANANTNLAARDVHYWGNAIGETGTPIGSNAVVDSQDVLLTNSSPSGFVLQPVTNIYDFNRDRMVNSTDVLIANANPSGFAPLVLFTAPASNSLPEGEGLEPEGELLALAAPTVEVSKIGSRQLGLGEGEIYGPVQIVAPDQQDASAGTGAQSSLASVDEPVADALAPVVDEPSNDSKDSLQAYSKAADEIFGDDFWM